MSKKKSDSEKTVKVTVDNLPEVFPGLKEAYDKAEADERDGYRPDYDMIPEGIMVVYKGTHQEGMAHRGRANLPNPYHFTGSVPTMVSHPKDVVFFIGKAAKNPETWSVVEIL